MIHALYSCPKLQDLWSKCPQWKQANLLLCPTFIDIMSIILVEQKHPKLFSMVVWTIWQQRNNSRLGKHVLLPSQILQQAQEKLQEFSTLHIPTSPPRTTPASCWRPPDHNYVKINFDGALGLVGIYLLSRSFLIVRQNAFFGLGISQLSSTK